MHWDPDGEASHPVLEPPLAHVNNARQLLIADLELHDRLKIPFSRKTIVDALARLNRTAQMLQPVDYTPSGGVLVWLMFGVWILTLLISFWIGQYYG